MGDNVYKVTIILLSDKKARDVGSSICALITAHMSGTEVASMDVERPSAEDMLALVDKMAKHAPG